MSLYPLRFKPVFRRYIWGGHRLATELGKAIGNESCAESWEVVDRVEENSVVESGSCEGSSLGQLIEHYGAELLGPSIHDRVNDDALPKSLKGKFPLLLKFLDANKTLSIQVHPDDRAGMAQSPPDLGKTEAWYVMDAASGSKIYAGLKEGVDRAALQAAIESGTTDQVVHSFEPSAGDCIFVPAGTVHAIGKGLLIAEIQQSSDTTFRLFDWNRVDSNGKGRSLHVEQALNVSDYDSGPVHPCQPVLIDGQRIHELVCCDKFVIRRWSLGRESATIKTENRFRLLMVVDGEMKVTGDPCKRPLNKGQTVLLPAVLGEVQLKAEGECKFLEIFVPE